MWNLIPWLGFEPASLSWKANSLPLDHQGRTPPLFIVRFSIWTLPKGNQSWIFIGKTNAEVETPILWTSDAKNWLLGKDPDAGKDWRQEEKGMTEDEMVGWHHWLDGHEFEQAPGVGDGQGSLVFCSPWGCKELDRIERLNWGNVQVVSPGDHLRACKSVNFKLFGP